MEILSTSINLVKKYGVEALSGSLVVLGVSVACVGTGILLFITIKAGMLANAGHFREAARLLTFKKYAIGATIGFAGDAIAFLAPVILDVQNYIDKKKKDAEYYARRGPQAQYLRINDAHYLNDQAL